MQSKLSPKQLEQFEKIVKNSLKVAVLAHTSLDPDAFGSALALARVLNLNYGVNTRFFTEDRIYSRWQVAFKDSVNKYVLSVPDVYTALRAYQPTTVFAVDIGHYHRLTGNPDYSRLQKFIETETKFQVCVDHHIANEPELTGLNIIADYTSTAELLFDIFHKLDLEHDTESAELLLFGLLGDLRRFRWLRDNKSFAKVEALLNIGANWHKVYSLSDFIFDDNVKEIILEAINRIRFSKYTAWVHIDNKLYSKIQHVVDPPRLVHDLIVDLISSSRKVFFLSMREKSKGKIYGSVGPALLGRGRHSVVEFAKKFGGGGHPHRAGFRVRTSEYTPEQIVELLDEYAARVRKK